MAHLHPELLGREGFDAFDYGGHYRRGLALPSAARETPVLAVATGEACQDAWGFNFYRDMFFWWIY